MRLIDADELKVNCVCLNAFCVDGRTIENAPTVKAIPIEWILNKYRGKWEKAEMGRRDFQFIEVIDELLADWEKENE